jgi:hypothetical protein
MLNILHKMDLLVNEWLVSRSGAGYKAGCCMFVKP